MTTYEDMLQAKNDGEAAYFFFKKVFENYLTDILKTLDMYERPVYCRNLKIWGVIRVTPDEVFSGFNYTPFRYTFFPLKKNGDVSQNSKVVSAGFGLPGFDSYETTVKKLRGNFSLDANNH